MLRAIVFVLCLAVMAFAASPRLGLALLAAAGAMLAAYLAWAALDALTAPSPLTGP